MGETILSARDLNRATLARQMLLERVKATPVAAIERLAGMQAQLARPPYVGLWSRLAGFEREELTRAIDKRTVVRATMMRATLHLVGAKDYRRWRGALQPMLDRGLKGVLRDRLDELDIPALCKEAAAFFTATPHTMEALRDHLGERHPKADERAMAYTVRCTLPLVQMPAAGSEWGYPGAAAFTTAESWLGEPIPGEKAADLADLVKRYLAAFGPASVADAQMWSGMRGLEPTFTALAKELRRFRDERGRELFDLPKAPRPDADAPAPPRFLPEYDNLLLGHDDRSRVIAADHRTAIYRPNLLIPPTFMVDGFVAGTWKASAKKSVATLEIAPFATLAKRVRDEVAAEAERLVRFVERDATRHEIRFAKPA